MKNKLTFLLKFVCSFLTIGILWYMIHKYYIYLLVKIINQAYLFSSLQRVWIRDQTIYFSFKDMIISPTPTLSFSNVLFTTINIVLVLSLLFATPSMGYKNQAKKMLIAVWITFVVHILSLYLDIFSFRWGSICTVNIFKIGLSQWPQIIMIKIAYFMKVFWNQLGNKLYPIVLWIILTYQYVFERGLIGE